MFGFRTLWQVPQAFNWAWSREWAAKEGARMPTRAELRNMNWQAIASGANGLVGWWFSYMVMYLKDRGQTESFRQVWDDVKSAYAEVAEKVPLLLSVEPAPKVRTLTKGLSARTWRKDGILWMLAVNRTYEPIAGVVGLDDGRQVRVRLEGLGCEFVELDKEIK